MKNKPYSVENIKWLDAEECNGWHVKGHKYEYALCECHSIGFVVHEDDTVLVLATTCVRKTEWYSTRLKIPKSCIVKRTKLKINLI